MKTSPAPAEQPLGDIEKLLHLILVNIDDLIAVVDLDGKRLYNSPSYERIFGNHVKLRGTNSFSDVHPDDREQLKQVFINTVKTGVGKRTRYRFLLPDGSIRHIESQGNVIRGKDGEPAKVVIVSRDVTEEKHAIDALMSSEERFRTVFEEAAVPKALLGTDERFFKVNSAFCAMIGYTREELADKELGLITFQHDSSEGRSFLEQLLHNDGSPAMEMERRFAHKNGSIVWGLVSAALISEREDAKKYFILEVQDISHQKKAEEERRRLISAVEQTAEGIVITDSNGIIVYANPGFERISGYSREEVIGRNPKILKSGAHTEEFYQGMWNTLTRGDTWSGHITNKRKDGTVSEEEMSISPVRDGLGKITNFVAVKRDVTHEREVEQQLMQSQKMESLGLLAGGIAHDFNNVLAVIDGSISFLARKITDPSVTKYVDMSQAAVNRGADVVKRLLSFSRSDEAHFSPILLADVTKELANVLKHSLERTIDIHTDVPKDLPAIIGDYGQLYQMLLNLSINARDAIVDTAGGGKTGTITIAASIVDGNELRSRLSEASEGRYIHITVADTGIGMTQDILDKAFQPFFTTKPIGKGTGLGLPVVYTIVKSHKGMIDLESEPGKGTTFHVYLPVSEQQHSKGLQAIDPAALGGHETILIVEDEEAVGSMLQEFLTLSGYTVLKALNGVEGVQTFLEHKDAIDIIISDLGMPRLSGYDMFMRIREIDPDVRVILTSGYMDSDLKRKLLDAGARRFITKPYSPMLVARAIREVLDEP
jgi:PAS domain S-box-containing protein